MGKREIREQVFKLLFQVEFNGVADIDEMSERYFNICKEEVAPEDEKALFEIECTQKQAADRLELVLSKLDEIDSMINNKELGWTTERFGKVELTVTRLALYEMKYDPEVPEAVAINEAIELAKKYASKEGAGFVNGVLAQFSENKGKSTSKGRRTDVKNEELLEKKKRTNSAKVLTVRRKKEN